MAIVMSNNAASTLASGISSGATSFTVASGSTFPALSSGDFTFVTIGTEVIKVTARSGANFTCDQTTASHSSGDTVELRVTSELLNAFSTDAESLAKAGGEMSGNITMAGSQTVDGRDLSADGSKLDGIDTGAKNDQTAAEIKTLLENGIDSVHYVNGSIDNEHIADDAINSEHYATGSIDDIHIANDAINSEHYLDGSIDTQHIADGQITVAKMAANSVDSAQYVNGSIDNEHIADDAINSEHYATGSIDDIHIANDAINSEHYLDGSIDTQHIADDQVTAAKLANSINTDIATGVTANTTANAALPKAGGAMTGALSVTTSSGGSNLSLIDTNAGATDAPELKLFKNSSSPADNDQIGFIGWHGRNSTAEDIQYGSMYMLQTDVSNATEDADFVFKSRAAGTYAERLTINGAGIAVSGGVTVGTNAVGTMTTDNDGSFAMSASNNFKCTPAGNFALTFTAIVAQSGNILFINSGGHTISAHANTKVDANLLATISTAGTYLLAYFSDGTNVYMTNSAAYA